MFNANNHQTMQIHRPPDIRGNHYDHPPSLYC